jgi:hypothetical protein
MGHPRVPLSKVGDAGLFPLLIRTDPRQTGKRRDNDPRRGGTDGEFSPERVNLRNHVVFRSLFRRK